MPIVVNCVCGKTFKVKDEYDGQQVTCQICGRSITASSLPAAASGLPAASTEPSAPPAPIANKASKPCSTCAEAIPEDSIRCPYCGDKVSTTLSESEYLRVVGERIASLDQYASAGDGAEADRKLAGNKVTLKTKVVGGIALLSIIMMVIGALMNGDGPGICGVVGILLGVFFIPGAIVSLVNDRRTFGVHEGEDAVRAFKKFFLAVRTGRTGRAFAMLHPLARNTARVETVTFQKIPAHTGEFSITDVASFKEYWKSITRGPTGQSRSCTLKKVKVVKEISDDAVVIEAEYSFSGYPSALAALILLNVIICAIVIACVTKRETKKVRKLMLRSHSRWHLVEGDFEGPLDKLQPA